MLGNGLEVILKNFSLSMFVFAAIFILLHRSIKRTMSEAEIVYRWMALFATGVTGIYAFVFHVFYPEMAAADIGWLESPFQFEVGMANLGFGLIAILSFNASYGFRLATVIGNTCWLWGDAYYHLMDLIKYHNYTLGNAGTWLWMDIFVPLILLVCIIRLRPKKLRTMS